MRALLPLAALAMALLVAQPVVAKEKPVAAAKKKASEPKKKAEAKKKAAAKSKAEAKKKGAKPEPVKAKKAVTPAKAKAKPVAKVDDDGPSLEEETVHVVKPGETLGGIANRAKVPRVLIAEANGLPKPWAVRVGQKLKLPRTKHHIVKAGETGFDIAYQYGVPFSSIAVANGLSPKAVLKTGQDLLIPTILAPVATTPAPVAAAAEDDADAKPAPKAGFIWPLDGKVRRGFTSRSSANYHDGIDIVAAPGLAVRAADGGTVIFAGKEPKSFGNLVVVQHGGGWQSAYGFLGKITVSKGDAVKKRERIGLVGRTGKATQDELHFELRKANEPVDPIGQLPAR